MHVWVNPFNGGVMKDSAHHLRNIQRKVIRSARQNGTATPEKIISAPLMQNETRVKTPISKRPSRQNSLPKIMKSQSYY